MSPHPGYGMSSVGSEYPANPYTPYPGSSYPCGTGPNGGYPGPVTTGYPTTTVGIGGGGYSPGPCYSMPPPQHSLSAQHDAAKNASKDSRYVHKVINTISFFFLFRFRKHVIIYICTNRR